MMDVFWSKPFVINTYQKYPEEDRQKIRTFALHVEKNGFCDLPGRNKFSGPPTDAGKPLTGEAASAHALAEEYNLWHYHVGIKTYIRKNKKYGDYTSNKVVHYSRQPKLIRIVDVNKHPPFHLPRMRYLLSTEWLQF